MWPTFQGHGHKANSLCNYKSVQQKCTFSPSVLYVWHLYADVLISLMLYSVFQVHPRKHRLLLEVFDENRLVGRFWWR